MNLLFSLFLIKDLKAVGIYDNNFTKNDYVIDPLLMEYKYSNEGFGGSDFEVSDGILEPKYSLEVSKENLQDDTKENKVSYYIVQKGDTVERIARKFGLKQETIIYTNKLNRKGFLRVGQKLAILPVDGVEYQIKKGDTLEKIAKKFKVKKEDIEEFNNLDVLKVGEKIIIPGAKISYNNLGKTSKKSSKRKKQTSKWIWIRTTDGRVVKHKAWVKTKRIRYSKADYGYFILPLPGAVRTQGLHGKNAIDMAAPKGTPVLAAHGGRVVKAFKSGYNGGYGHYVVIDHGDGIKTLYAHLGKVIVYKGQKVAKGQVIGYEGSTGRSTGPHLHFEVHGRKNPF